MFIPQLENLEKLVHNKDLDALDALLSPTGRIQNRKSNFKSALMLSAHNLKHLLKIDTVESDCIVLNLEDGVSTQEKPVALRLCAYFLSKIHQSPKKIVVRINALDEGGLDEIAFLNAYKPDAIRVPKIKDINDIHKVLKVLDENIELHLSIETKQALNNLKQLQYNNKVKAVYLGILDLLADLGLSQDLLVPENPTIHYILAEFLLGAKSIGAHPVSFVYQDYQNMHEFQRWLALEKMMGFTSKGCVSPMQAQEVISCFEIKDIEIQKAKYIIELFEKMREQGITGFADEKYGFIDEPIYKGALKIVQDR
ncbi:CoA ester lyase [Sulfurimonas sp. MAG313]|nr:aldolase/citrate lyase family protein [Sulfurimonas sp. MAG313]MDF1881141.1 CoA ester lyase [Sulfurimonas sp. MAG313]